MERIDLLIAFLEFYIESLYDKMKAYLLITWNDSAEGFNHGQYVIYEHFIVPTLDDWLEITAAYWPFGDVGWYLELCYNCFDVDVMERAFSDTIHEPEEKMQEIIDLAIFLNEIISALAWA